MMLPGIIAIVTTDHHQPRHRPEAGAYGQCNGEWCPLGYFQNNAGAWDNAKKSFEKGVEINGQTYYRNPSPTKRL